MATGFLTRAISWSRKFMDEAIPNQKYTDDDIIDLIEVVWTGVLEEMNRLTQDPIIVRHNVTFTEDSKVYELPPTISNVLRIAKINSTTGYPEWIVDPNSRFNPSGPGLVFEGNTIYLEPDWSWADETLQIDYIPAGSVRLHEGTAGTITNSTSDNNCTFVLAASPTTGALDTRPNAYAGSILRVLTSTSGYVQDRIIKSYDVTTRTATLEPAYTLVPDGTVTYEICPIIPQASDMVVPLGVAMFIGTAEGSDKTKSLERLHQKELRKLRLNVSNFDTIKGLVFESDTSGNSRYLRW